MDTVEKQSLKMERIAAVAGGLLILGIWLVGWRLASDAANWFGPATALFGLGLWFISLNQNVQSRPNLALTLRIAGLIGIGLALGSAISLGAFLPSGLAEWGSPVLGKWGGTLTTAIIGFGLILGLLSGLLKTRRRFWLNAATFLMIVTIFINFQTDRQRHFPTPPTNSADLRDGAGLFLLLIIGWIGVLGMAGLVLYVARRFPGWRTISLNQPILRWLWGWVGLTTAWVTVSNLLWTVLGGLDWNYLYVGWFALSGLMLIGMGVLAGWPWKVGRLLKSSLARLGWLGMAMIALIVVYFGTTEDLEAVLLRNTTEYRVMQFWRATTGDERFASRATGGFDGQVRGLSQQPEVGATVVLADEVGQTYTATTGPDGRYKVSNVPAGNYLPMVVSQDLTAYSERLGGPVVTIRAGQTTANIDFARDFTPVLSQSRYRNLEIGEPSIVTRDNPESVQAIRRSFSFQNEGVQLSNGLIHEPPANLGPGPFPILLTIYPGPTDAWESVSVQLAAKGYVVVSYYPDKRLLDLEGTLSDLRLLTDFVTDGQMSKRGDPKRVALVGGSVSTAFTYLMAQDMAVSPHRANLKAMVNYGGLIDLYRFRYTWERGQVVIDPGISQLEYLLIGLGRPDTRPELWLRFSPAFRLRPAELPPTLLVHVQKDIIVPVEQSERANRLLQSLQTPTRLLVYPELEHYLDLSKRDPAYEDMLNQTVAFLKQNL